MLENDETEGFVEGLEQRIADLEADVRRAVGDYQQMQCKLLGEIASLTAHRDRLKAAVEALMEALSHYTIDGEPDRHDCGCSDCKQIRKGRAAVANEPKKEEGDDRK